MHGWCHMKCCRLGASSVYTIQPCTSLQCLFIQSHIGRLYVCLAVTCHLHFWQNDRDLLRATVVTLGWNGYRNKSQHRKLTLEKKIIPPLLPGLEPGTYRSRVQLSSPIETNASFEPFQTLRQVKTNESFEPFQTYGCAHTSV